MSTGVRIDSSSDLQSVDKNLFSDSSNFRIVLENVEDSGSRLSFTDFELGKVVTFPWWEDPAVDIRDWSISDIPGGLADSPYWDADQGWHIFLWRDDEHVFVAQGGETENWFETLLKVSIDLYRSEWERVIQSLLG